MKSKTDYITQKEKPHRRTMLLEGEAVLFGAANEVRTRDVLLGKQVLYQLSYSRIILSEKYSTASSQDQDKSKVQLTVILYSVFNMLLIL